MLGSNRGRRLRMVAAGLTGLTLLAGCAEGGSSASGGGEGVEFGASIEEYREAFAEIDPITIYTQSSAAEGSLSGRKFEEYFAAVSDWSDGKIVFDVQFANAVAPPTEVDNALTDGRLDLGSVLPLYEPSEYPLNQDFINSMVVGSQTAQGGLLELHGWITETGYETEAIRQEFEDAGMHMLLPAFTSGSSAMYCKDEPADSADAASGAQVAVGTTSMADQVEAIGGTPVSLPYTELFESLQRGVIDCTVSVFSVAVLAGFIEEAPHAVLDPEVGFGQGPGALAVSQATWDGLPLVAQQLLFDRLDVFLEANFNATWETIVEATNQVADAGGEFVPFDDDLREKFQQSNAQILEDLQSQSKLGEDFFEAVGESNDKWATIVADLELEGEPDYNVFAQTYEPGSVELEQYFDKLFDEALLEHRPS